MTRPSPVSSSLSIAVVTCFGVAACLKEVTFESKATLGHAAPIDRMLVVMDVQNQALDADIYRGLEIGLSQRLGSCRIRAKVLHDMRANPLDPTSTAFQAVQPVAVMSIELASPPYVRNIGFATAVSAVFAFKLVDLASHETTWIARSKLEVRSMRSHMGLGGRFATEIVSRLRDDGVLASCPAAGAGWPELDLPRPPPDPDPGRDGQDSQ